MKSYYTIYDAVREIEEFSPYPRAAIIHILKLYLYFNGFALLRKQNLILNNLGTIRPVVQNKFFSAITKKYETRTMHYFTPAGFYKWLVKSNTVNIPVNMRVKYRKALYKLREVLITPLYQDLLFKIEPNYKTWEEKELFEESFKKQKSKDFLLL